MLTFKVSREVREEVEHKLEVAEETAAQCAREGADESRPSMDRAGWNEDAAAWVTVADALRSALATPGVLTISSAEQAAHVATEMANAMGIARGWVEEGDAAEQKRTKSFVRGISTLLRDLTVAFGLKKNEHDEFTASGALNGAQARRRRVVQRAAQPKRLAYAGRGRA